MNLGWVGGLIAAAVVALIAWAVVDMNDWEGRCEAAGGVVESRYIGDIVTYVQSGSVQVPVVTPNYSYHCMVDGVERSL